MTLKANRAIPCGLILNELLANCFKRAFPAGRVGEIRIVLRQEAPKTCTLTVCDTGVGFPDALDFRQTDSLGLQLICLLTEQLGGTITLERERGTTFRITFPA